MSGSDLDEPSQFWATNLILAFVQVSPLHLTIFADFSHFIYIYISLSLSSQFQRESARRDVKPIAMPHAAGRQLCSSYSDPTVGVHLSGEA